MSDRSAPIWPAEYGGEPGWWQRVRSAFEDNETTLDLFECQIGPEGGKALVERGLPKLPQLTTLNLGADDYSKRNRIGPKGATALATQGLPHVTQLTSLDIGYNNIGPEGAKTLATQGLPHVTQLTSLDIGYNDIGPEGATALATRGLPHATQLTSLNLGENSIGPEGATALATQGLPHVTQLTSLDLYNNRIGDEGATALATQGLPHVTQLTSLNLECSDIGIEGATALATRGLPKVTQLTSFDLNNNHIGDEGATALATQGLPHVTQLTSLDIGYNDIGPEGATALATDGLPHVTQLTSLDLGENDIGSEGAKALATQGLPHVTQLTSLDLGYNDIGPEGATALAKKLSENILPSLTDFYAVNLRDHLKAMQLPRRLHRSYNAAILRFLRERGRSGARKQRPPQQSAATTVGLPDLTTATPLWWTNVQEECRTYGGRRLHLDRQGLTDADVDVLVEHALMHLPNLESLNLSFNDISNDGAWALFNRGIGRCQKLQELRLTGNPRISDGAGERVAEVLLATPHPTLRTVEGFDLRSGADVLGLPRHLARMKQGEAWRANSAILSFLRGLKVGHRRSQETLSQPSTDTVAAIRTRAAGTHQQKGTVQKGTLSTEP
eukprot:scaffold3666_cov315-Pinguiococcus_pyrenoidosus.AAC.4